MPKTKPKAPLKPVNVRTDDDIHPHFAEDDVKDTIASPTRKPRRKSPLEFRRYTKQIWLAGLGAFSRSEEEGKDHGLFDSLVKAGEELEAKTEARITEVAEQTVEKVVDAGERAIDYVTDAVDRVEKILDQPLARIQRVPLVLKDDQGLDHGTLATILERIEQQLADLNRQQQLILQALQLSGHLGAESQSEIAPSDQNLRQDD